MAARCFLPLALLLVLSIGCGKSNPPPVQVETQPEDDQWFENDIKRLTAQLAEKNPARRQAAVDAIVEWDEWNEDVIPPLLGALEDPSASELGHSHPRELHSTREAATKALLKLGPKGEKALLEKGLPILQRGLLDSRATVREHTAHAIRMIGPKASAATEQLVELCRDPAKEVRLAAYRTLETIGSAPAPPILKLLTHDDAEIRVHAADALNWLPLDDPEATPLLVEALTDTAIDEKSPRDAAYVRNAAAAALGRLGPKAEEAIPALIDALKKASAEELRLTLMPEPGSQGQRIEPGPMQALRRIGKPAVPALIPLLKDSQYVVRWQAASILGGIGPDASAALPDLQAALEGENEAFVVISATALAQVQIGGDPTKPVERLTALLDDMNPPVRAATAKVLERFGRAAAGAVDKLIPLLDDADEMVRLAAVDALRAVGPAARSAVPTLIMKLADEKPELRLAAMRALRGLGPYAADAVPELRKALTSDDLSLRETAVETVIAIGPPAKAAVPELAKMLGMQLIHPNHYLPIIAAVAAIGPDAREAAPALLKLLDEKDTTLRLAVLDALGRIEAGGPEVLTRLTTIVQRDPFNVVRTGAIRALGRMGPAAKDAAPALQGLVDGKVPEQRIGAAAALARIGVDPKQHAAIVIKALADPAVSARHLRLTAIDAAALLGPAGADAVPELIELLRDRSTVTRNEKQQVRERAALALSHLGEAAKPAVPAIAGLLDDGEPGVRYTAIESLARLGPIAAEAADQLREVARTDEALGRLALEALDRIEPPKGS
jgi:HEAT repeat protein